MIRTPKRVRLRSTVTRIVIAATQRISDHSQAPISWLGKFGDPFDADSGIGVACVMFE